MKNFLARADLHLHSKASNLPGGWFSKLIGCPESYAEPMELYKRLKQRGMTFVTITDHNTISGVLEIAHLPDVFISCEYTVEFPEEEAKVHVIAYGINEKQHEDLLKLRGNVYEFVEYLKYHNIAHTLAHPLYSVQGTKITRRLIDKMVLLFDTWEVINGTRGDGVMEIEETIARAYSSWDVIRRLEEKYKIRSLRSWERISFTAGSDDHGSMDVGRTWTQIEGAKSIEEFLLGLRDGRSDVGTEELSEDRLVNTVARVGYVYINKHFGIPQEIRSVLDYVLMYSDDPAVAMGLRFLLGVDAERTKLVRALLDSLPFFMWNRFLKNRSVTGLFGFILSLIPYAFPYLIKYMQKKEERRVKALAKEFGIVKQGPVKIAYFTDTYKELNGVARTANIMKAIALEEDLPFHFFVCSKERTRKENLTSLKPLIEVPTPFYKELKMGVPDFKDLVEELERGGFTGVHVSTPGPLGLMAFLAGKLLGLRVTFAFHTDIPTYACVYTGDGELEGFLWKVFVFLANSSDRFFVPSEHYRRLFLSKGVEPSKVRVFRRGVDTKLFSPYKRNENFWNDRLGKRVERVILYVGRVAKEKNLETFFYVAKGFPEETFVVVGDGPYREELEKIKPKNVHFVGYLRGEELAKAYASSYVFLFPSETETYAQVVLEAMASGLPVVVSSKGAANEHVEDGLNGFIATEKTDFIDRLCLLLEDESLRDKMAAEALYRAKSLELRKTYMEYMLNIAGKREVLYEVKEVLYESCRYRTLLSF